ncbi:MAG: response regulator [Bacteroidota bacterium]
MGKLIHIVEDDDDIRFIVEYVLVEEGYNIASSSNLKDFYDAIEKQHPDLILLDVMLPDGNGIDICRSIKDNQDTSDIKIIIMSAHAAEKAVIEEACSDGFISKPFDLDFLLSYVKRILAN